MQTLPKQVHIVDLVLSEVLPSWVALRPHQLDIAIRLTDAGMPTLAVGALDAESGLLGELPPRKGVRYLAEGGGPLTAMPRLPANWPGELMVRATASETFSRRHLDGSLAAVLDHLAGTIDTINQAGFKVRGRVAGAFGCPYEGELAPLAVAAVAGELYAMGCDSVVLSDLTGHLTPDRVRRVFEAVDRRVPVKKLAVRWMDSYGLGIANLLASLQCGVTTVETATGGVLPNPWLPGCAGTLASEDVVYLLDGMEVRTGVDLGRLAETGRLLAGITGLPTRSHVAQALRSVGI